HGTILPMDRQRAGHAPLGQMFHQAEEERQIDALDALFVQRQDVGARGGVEQEVGVLRALGDARVGKELADGVLLKKPAELVLGDVRVDRQSRYALPLTKAMSAGRNSTSRRTRLTGKFSVSSAVTASSTVTSKRSLNAST